MFRALPCSSSGGPRRNCIYAASGIVTLCRWLSYAPVKKELQFFLNRCTRQSPAERERIPEAAYIQLRSRPPEDEHVEDFNKCIICKQIRILCIDLEIKQGFAIHIYQLNVKFRVFCISLNNILFVYSVYRNQR